MPIRKFDRIFDERSLWTGKHETIVECDPRPYDYAKTMWGEAGYERATP